LYCESGFVEDEPAEHFTVSNLTEANNLVRDALKHFPFFRVGPSKMAGMSYFANHCEACGALQGDFDLHSEPGGPFCPESRSDFARIEFIAIDGQIEVTGDDGYGPMDDAFTIAMQKE
jgi:hypothetical protein